MKIIEPSAKILSHTPDPLQLIERCGRICYKSEDRITNDSADGFIRRIISMGHESVLEHASATVLIVCDRGVSHEICRHRLCAFSQESTRYCNYGKSNEITVIRPCFDWSELHKANWQVAMLKAESTYLTLLATGRSPQEARSVLPNSLKTEIAVTANFREWRHIFRLRCSSKAHPQMRQIMIPLRDEFAQRWLSVFGDITNVGS